MSSTTSARFTRTEIDALLTDYQADTATSATSGATLVEAHTPLLKSFARAAARRGRFADFQDTYDEYMGEAFLLLAEVMATFDTTTQHSFSKTMETKFRMASYTDPVGTVISVPSATARRFYDLITAHGSVATAYRACVEDSVAAHMSPEVFMQVRRALDFPAEMVSTDEDGNDVFVEGPSLVSSSDATLVDAEAAMWAETAHRLLTVPTPRQQRVARLTYGFTDEPTETLRAMADMPMHKALTRPETAITLGCGEATVKRDLATALTTMHDAYTAGLFPDDEDDLDIQPPIATL